MQRVIAGTVRIGAAYEYLGQGGGGTLYRPLDFIRHAQHFDCRTGYQELVLYEGLDGRDKGTRWCCTLADWALRFRPVVNETESASPLPQEGKVAGDYERGTGV